MSELSKDISHVPTLSSDNYPTWQRKMNAYFRFNDLWGIVHSQEVRPSDAAAQPDWDKRAMRASGAIEMTLDDKNSTHVEGIEGNPVQMWQKLDSIHNNKTPGTRFNAMDILFNIRKEEDETLNGLITRVKAAMSRVKSLRPVSAGQPASTSTPSITVTTSTGTVSPVVPGSQAYTLAMLDDELVIMSLLRALPEDYKHLRSALLIQKSLALQAVEDAFVAEDGQRQHAARDGAGAGATALKAFTPSHSSHSSHKTSASSKPKGDRKCFFCDIPGHTEAECKQKKWAREKILKRRAEKANAADNTKSTTESHEEFAESASTLPLPPEARSDLNADTGATRIMMGNESFFSTLRPLVRTIRVANGASIQSKGEGEVVFQPWVNGDFSTSLIVFPNVLFAPNLQSNLVSVLSLVQKQNYEVRINKRQMEFYREGTLCMTARIDDNCVAHLDGRVVSAEAANAASTCPLDRELWHRRLAHINHSNLDTLIRHNLLRDLKINSHTKTDPICIPCISGKQTRAIHTTPAPRSTTLLDRVSTDLHGPIHTEALPSRARYWMPFVDEASGYIFLSLLRTKDVDIHTSKMSPILHPERLETTKNSVEATIGLRPTNLKIIGGIWKLPVYPQLRDLLWNSLIGRLKIGKYWQKMRGYEERSQCMACKQLQNMQNIEDEIHMWIKCENNGQRECWSKARQLWQRCTSTAWPDVNIGTIWGIGAFRFTMSEGNATKITDSERFGTMASLAIWSIWKAQNNRAMNPDRLTNTDTASSIFKDVLKDVIRKSWISTNLEPENRRQKREERLRTLWGKNSLAVLERGKPPIFGF